MPRPLATLEIDDEGVLMSETALIDEPQPMRGGAMKFAYTSGARPLEGYTIKRGIGVGGFGEVYFATSDAGKEVALKRIQRNLDVELRGVSQCLNLKHVNLISLFDIKYDDHGQGWVVMEYVSGESLKDVIERNPNGMPRDEVHEWFAGLAAGVSYLHDHGIVHRDLKPGNIFADDGVVKIGDYGLSKFVSCSRRSGQTESVGTFHYMAPEIGKGVYGKEIDIYALGIVLFEMLTGRVPFEGESSQEIIMKHLTSDPDLSGLAQPYRGIIAKALAKDPDHRFANVAEMNAALQSGSEIGLVLLERAKRITTPVAPVDAPELVAFAKREPPLPPVVVAAQMIESPDGGTLYITDEVPQPEIVFGPVKHQSPPKGGLRTKAAVTPPVVLPPARGVRPAALAQARRSKRRFNVEAARKILSQKTASEKVTELTGSLLMAALVSGAISLLALFTTGKPFEASDWSNYGWLAICGTLGAWTLLSLGKFWEGREGEPIQRRFMMLIAGMFLGAAFFGVENGMLANPGDALRPDWFGSRGSGVSAFRMLPSLYSAEGAPRVGVYLAYFAGLFLLLRWWKQTDPLRASRVSLIATGLCVLGAWVLDAFWLFPQPSGVLLVATISLAVQLSAPWMSHKDRARIREQLQEA